MISNNERIRIRRQMQRRIRDVVAERRRARQMQTIELAGETETRADVDVPALSNS
ncbi:hypothetical protein [Micromonospora inyonensis]|uniref:Uncharacterized protein n=1 Tax=Micromonospora inyonensis TaxID=47866 RepID=A0A1C6R8W9_9ACTN|nr:hypothetical protein [Micromonospora inyonensis]SCL13437.1 hypothetical protein GA0074694_0331 [Micromonospora inyonensis]